MTDPIAGPTVTWSDLPSEVELSDIASDTDPQVIDAGASVDALGPGDADFVGPVQPDTGTVDGSDDEPVTGSYDAEGAALEAEQLARGADFVGGLRDSGALSPERASGMFANVSLLEQIGSLVGDGSDAAGTRAAEVLITDVGTSVGTADAHLSQMARRGEIGEAQFKALANDQAFLDTLLPLTSAEGGSPAAADRLVDQALTNLAVERAPTDGAGEVYRSRDGLLFVAAGTPEVSPVSGVAEDGVVNPAAEADDAPRGLAAPIYVAANGQALPEELQAKLDAASATDEGIDPYTLRGAQALTGDVPLAPSEQFAAASYLGGGTNLDLYLEQINDGAFLADPTTQRAAEVMLGTNPQGHTAGEDFLNSLYAGGHITQAKFVEHANDPAFLADTDAAVASGTVTYTTENYGRADELLGASEEDMAAALAPGYRVGEGLPTPEQVAALYEAGGRSDRNFTELGAAWVTEHNPDVQLRYGLADPHDPETSFFFEQNGQIVSDPFLDALTADLQAPTQDDDGDLTDAFHAVRRAAIDDDEPLPASIPAHVKFEGVSGEAKDETTDASRHAAGIVFAGKDIDDVLDARPGIGFDVDDNFAGGEYVDGIDGKARQVLEAIDPNLFGEQITQIDGVDGLSIVNGTRFDTTTVRADDADGLTVDVSGNAGDLTVVGSDTDDLTIEGGAGQEQFIGLDEGQSAIGSGFAPDGVNEALTRSQQDQMVADALLTFVLPDGQFDTAAFEAALDSAPGLLDGDRQYIGDAVIALTVTAPDVAG